jgi:hypothetical protein
MSWQNPLPPALPLTATPLPPLLLAGDRQGQQGPQVFLLLVSAGLLVLASLASSRVQSPAGSRHTSADGKASSPVPPGPPGSASGWRRQVHNVLEGFYLIIRSGYLLLLCLFLLLTYMVGSLMYFERSLVVAQQVTSTSSRTAFFARVNSYSAFIITGMQLTVTGEQK